MPTRPPKACSKTMCKGYATDGTSRCNKHKIKQASGWAKYNNGNTANDNGYGYQWRKLRESVLARDRYLCQTCYRLGQFTNANIVDHIINKANGGTNNTANLEAICFKCHKRKTNREASRVRTNNIHA